MSPKQTKNKLVIEITPLQMAFFVYGLYRHSMGVGEQVLKFSLKLDLFSLCMAMRIFSACSCLHFHYLGHENVKWLILVQVMQHMCTPWQYIYCGAS